MPLIGVLYHDTFRGRHSIQDSLNPVVVNRVLNEGACRTLKLEEPLHTLPLAPKALTIHLISTQSNGCMGGR